MSFLGSALKIGKGLIKNPLVKTAMGVIPGASMALTAVDLASNLGVFGGSNSAPSMGGIGGGLPALPGVQGRGAAGVPAPGQTGGFGLPRGPGGKLQLPWHDPRIPEFLKQFALDDSFIRLANRAPRGYVIVRDASGRPFPVMKQIAKQFKVWKPKAKPPISVRDWHALKRSAHTIKKLDQVVKMSKKIARHAAKGHHHAAGPVAHHRKAK